jgi:hypothetical protein
VSDYAFPTAFLPYLAEAAGREYRRRNGPARLTYTDRLLETSIRLARELWPAGKPRSLEAYLGRRAFLLGDLEPWSTAA